MHPASRSGRPGLLRRRSGRTVPAPGPGRPPAERGPRRVRTGPWHRRSGPEPRRRPEPVLGPREPGLEPRRRPEPEPGPGLVLVLPVLEGPEREPGQGPGRPEPDGGPESPSDGSREEEVGSVATDRPRAWRRPRGPEPGMPVSLPRRGCRLRPTRAPRTSWVEPASTKPPASATRRLRVPARPRARALGSSPRAPPYGEDDRLVVLRCSKNDS